MMNNLMSLTGHCIIKNEDKFIKYAILSVIDFLDTLFVYDTGSTDNTVSIIEELKAMYPKKILFEQKGEADKKRHTQLRQEMIEKTTSDWFMILDGDEIWTKRAMKEALRLMNKKYCECIFTYFYLCVGDVYHTTKRKGQVHALDRKGHFYPRFAKKTKGIHWAGDYNEDCLYDENNKKFFTVENTIFMKERFWHVSHLKRSTKNDSVYSSGASRLYKQKLTYLFIGKEIKEKTPEVFDLYPSEASHRLSFFGAIKNLITTGTRKYLNYKYYEQN